MPISLAAYNDTLPGLSLPQKFLQRSRAFNVCPYPCIGQFKFLNLTLFGHPLYPHVLDRIKQGETLLDFGCGLGQDLRKLVADGAPSTNICGLDIEPRLIDIGYELFLDRNSLQSKFTIEDVYNPNANWDSLTGKFDIINASAFFHLFPRPKQLEASCTLVCLGRSRKGTLIVGRTVGSLAPSEYPSFIEGESGFRHDLSTLQQLWDEVGEITGTRWEAEGSLDSVDLHGIGGSAKNDKTKPDWAESNMRRLLFTIKRL